MFSLADLDIPVIQAPMAGSGITTPDLVAAASSAGALGSIAATYCRVDQLCNDVAAVRARTNRPFAINLFAPTIDPPRPDNADKELDRLRRWHTRFGLPEPTLPATASESFPTLLQAILTLQPDVVSCTFGLFPEDAITRLKAVGAYLMGTATTVNEAVLLERAGFDAVIAQGFEAGGHRGSFVSSKSPGLIALIALLPQVVDAVSVPVVASGGIMDGRGIAAALALGASAVQMGTAFLVTRESGAPQCYKDKVISASDDATVLTSAFSGRLARGIANGFTKDAEELGAEPLPYPWQNALTRPLRKAAIANGDPEALSLWAGQGAGLSKEQSVSELILFLREGLDQAIADLLHRGGQRRKSTSRNPD